MAKYLSMTSVPTEELEELQAEYSWNSQAVTALKTIEQFHGDLVAVICDVAVKTGVQAELLLKAADERCKAILRDDDVTEDLPDMVNSITTGITAVAIGASAGKLAPFAPVLGYCTALAVKKGIKLYTGKKS